MAWPTSSDLLVYLRASGLVSSTLTSTEELLDFSGAVSAAIDQWEDETGWSPFVSTGAVEYRRFLPPIGALLDLGGGLLTLSTLAVDCTYTNGSGTAYTDLLHFRLLPRDAPQKTAPYTHIEFLWSPQSVTDSEVVVSGTWGYCTDANLPSAAKRGVLALAACELMPQLKEATTAGV